jgi:hypothetical protein
MFFQKLQGQLRLQGRGYYEPDPWTMHKGREKNSLRFLPVKSGSIMNMAL